MTQKIPHGKLGMKENFINLIEYLKTKHQVKTRSSHTYW